MDTTATHQAQTNPAKKALATLLLLAAIGGGAAQVATRHTTPKWVATTTETNEED